MDDFGEKIGTAFQVADDLRPYARDRRNTDLLKGKTLLTAFYQPSTRTRLSTEAAMHRLGGHVLGFSDAKMTRAGDFYQESIKDTFRMLESYGDVIAIRHFQEGAPAEAAKWASVPIINCGDGWGQHPTRVLTDLYTILLDKGTLDGLTYLLVGDMRMRTMHSILHALSQFDAEAIVVSPPDIITMPADTEIEKRNRALVAFTLLTGARDSAIASMKLKHVDLNAGCVNQDAREVQTKFSKTFSTFFFPEFVFFVFCYYIFFVYYPV